MSEVFEHNIHLSIPSSKKLKSMMPVKIKHTSINPEKDFAPFHCHADNHAKLMHAFEHKKTATITLSPDEVALNENEHTGTGFFKVLHSIGISKKQFNKPGKAIVKAAKQVGITPKSTVSALKTVAKIALPTLAKAGAAAGTAYLTGNPLAAKIASDVAGNAVQSQMSKIGSGLYIQHGKLKVRNPSNTGVGISYNQYDAQNIKDGTLGINNVLAHDHPARNPYIIPSQGVIQQPYAANPLVYGSGIYAPGRSGAGIYAR
jgi:hypothetical protein